MQKKPKRLRVPARLLPDKGEQVTLTKLRHNNSSLTDKLLVVGTERDFGIVR